MSRKCAATLSFPKTWNQWVQVSDVLGRVVGSYRNINSNQFTIPSASIQKGVYLIKILNSEGRVYTFKLQR